MDIFNQLCCGSLTFKGKKIIIPQDIQLLPKTHIPNLWGHSGAMISKILKPNFLGDRYILEFISLETPLKNSLEPHDFEKINTKILEHLSIDLSSMYDRSGSFIFQFPITLVSGNAGISSDWCKSHLSMDVHQSFTKSEELCSMVTTKLDDIVTGFSIFDGLFENLELDIGDSNNLEFKVVNKKNGLIYVNSMRNFARGFNMHVGSQNSEPRIIKNSNGENTEIELFSYDLSKRTNRIDYNYRTNKRILNNEIISKSGHFKNFYSGQRDEVLGYIRELKRNNLPEQVRF
jgi:hypothetical protein